MINNILGVATQVVIMAIIISVVILFVGIGFLILLHVCIIGRTSRGGGRGTMGERGINGGRSMSKDDLEKLPCYDYTGQDNTSSPVNCAVCLENLTTGDKCRLLPMCKHSFHAQCVDTWLLKAPICPICRANAGGQSQRGSSVTGRNGQFNTEANTGEGQTATRGQPNDIRVQLTESPESGSSTNLGIELRENRTQGSPNSREHQTSMTDQLTSPA